jgi:hypothetical protein
MLPASREAKSRPALMGIGAILIVALLGISASFAFANGPLALLGRSTKPSSSKFRIGKVGQAVLVTRSRYFHFHHHSHDPTPTPDDPTAPQTSIMSGPPAKTKSTAASFTFSSSEAGSSFECKIDSTNWGSCATPKTYSGLAVGSHQFSVRAIDAAKNVDTTPASDSWTVEKEVVTPPPADTTAPQTSITSGPAASTISTAASFAFSSSESGSSFECKLDGAAWAACTTPKDYSGVAVGDHQFSVRAIDGAKNVDASPASQSWTVEAVVTPPPGDTTPPQTSITSGPAATTIATAASFAFSASESGSSFECKLDSGAWGSCATPKAYSGVAVGSHQFSVRAIDAAKNVDATPAAQSWTVEKEVVTPPPPPNDECTSVVTSTTAAQSAASSAAPGSVVCLADGSYGSLSLNATKAAPGVTVRAEHPGKAVLSGASLQGTRLTLARFNVNGEVTIQPGSTGMVVDHNRITGGYMGVNAGPTSSTQINDAAITNNQLVGPFGEDAIRLNRYHDADGNGVGILVEGNEISHVRENGAHSDCLQAVWVGDHLVYRKNYLHDNRCQGFFVKDQASPVVGIAVEDNLFVRNNEPCEGASGCGQPAYFQVFGPYSGFVMRRNTFWTGDQVATFQNGTGADTKIENNVIYRLWNNTNMSAITFANNTRCKRETAEGGSWPSSTPGETVNCSPAFNNPAVDDLRLIGSDRGVDWAPAEQDYGP